MGHTLAPLQVSAVQVSPTEMVVECHKTGIIHSIKSDVNIKGVFVTKVITVPMSVPI